MPTKTKPVGLLRYTTRHIELKLGDQLRITYGRRTLFVYCNRRGVNVSAGGYVPRKGQP